MFLGAIKIRDPIKLTQALNTMRNIFHCNFNELDEYFQFEGYEFIASHNSILLDSCRTNTTYCSNPAYVSTVCQFMPYHIIKEVRLLVKHSETFLTDPKLNVKIILLIRDPRGIINSRERESWCKGHPDCENVSNLCKVMEIDFVAAKRLTQKYPHQFTVLRYEDLCIDPFNITQKILTFYGLPYHNDVKHFLSTHTQLNYEDGDSFSTFRNSKKTPFQWMREMSFDNIQMIQATCNKAMNMWGYQLINDEIELRSRDFNPLLEFPSFTGNRKRNKSY